MPKQNGGVEEIWPGKGESGRNQRDGKYKKMQKTSAWKPPNKRNINKKENALKRGGGEIAPHTVQLNAFQKTERNERHGKNTKKYFVGGNTPTIPNRE